jgi:hypothetical protein
MVGPVGRQLVEDLGAPDLGGDPDQQPDHSDPPPAAGVGVNRMSEIARREDEVALGLEADRCTSRRPSTSSTTLSSSLSKSSGVNS